MYRLIGDLAGPSFFSINETTGVISVRNDLGLGVLQKYTLRVQVSNGLCTSTFSDTCFDTCCSDMSSLTHILTYLLSLPVTCQRQLL